MADADCRVFFPRARDARDRPKLAAALVRQEGVGGTDGGGVQVNLELQSLKGAMRVNCRVRPLRPGPEAEDGTCVHLRGLGKLSMLDKNGAKEFQFDHVYGPNNKQDVLFDDARPLLQVPA